jgi:hypothetical protein
LPVFTSTPRHEEDVINKNLDDRRPDQLLVDAGPTRVDVPRPATPSVLIITRRVTDSDEEANGITGEGRGDCDPGRRHRGG